MIAYRILNKTNGKSYIGQTSSDLNVRIYRHLHDRNSIIGNEMNILGSACFDVSVLDVCGCKDDADRSERFWIRFYDSIENGYNIHTGGTPEKKWMDDLRKKKSKPFKHTEKFLKKKRKKEEALDKQMHKQNGATCQDYTEHLCSITVPTRW